MSLRSKVPQLVLEATGVWPKPDNTHPRGERVVHHVLTPVSVDLRPCGGFMEGLLGLVVKLLTTLFSRT